MDVESSPNWESLIGKLRIAIYGEDLPYVTTIAKRDRNAYRVLTSTMISLRTKDDVTASASERLFKRADNPADMSTLDESEIAKLIYPSGFYQTKAKHIKRSAELLLECFDGDVPKTRDELMTLPGVGRKTANLTLNLGYGIDAICVDTHVHRISNRLGLVLTGKPEDTEIELEKKLPRRYWIEINTLLVFYGQRICRPISPLCSECSISSSCPRIGVTKSR